MTKFLRLFSMLAVLGFVVASVQPADARHHRGHKHWGHHHHHMMKFQHCHMMNKKVWSKRWHTWTWKHVRVCT